MTIRPVRTVGARAGATGLGAIVLLVLTLTGCASPTVNGGGSGPGGSGPGGSGPGGSSTTTPIDGSWTLVSGSDQKGAITPGTAVVPLKLDGKTSGGKGPCNAYGASVNSSTTGPLTITLGIRTEMACVESEFNTTEARYFAALGKIRSASIAHAQLSLTGGGDTLVFARTKR
jgi:heat shock protein HslJ